MSKSRLLTTLVAVSALVLTSAITPASARWPGGGWRGAGIAAAIGAGLALGAAAACMDTPSLTTGTGTGTAGTGTGTVVVVAGASPPRLTADPGRSQTRQQLSHGAGLPLADAARGANTACVKPRSKAERTFSHGWRGW